jgi:hypothetical protein
MIASIRSVQLAGVSTLAVLAFGVALQTPAYAVCGGTADVTETVTPGATVVTTNSVTVNCDGGTPDTGLFNTGFSGFSSGGYTLSDYDGNGDDTLNLDGGAIFNPGTPSTNPTPVISGIPYFGSTISRDLNPEADVIDTLGGNDTVIVNGSVVSGGITLGDGTDAFTLISGSVEEVRGAGGNDAIDVQGGDVLGDVYGDAGVGPDGDDTIRVFGTGEIGGGIYGGGGSDTISVGLDPDGLASGGLVNGSIFGDDAVGPGNDTVIVGGDGRVEGSIFTSDGGDRVRIEGNGSVGVATFPGVVNDASVGLGDGDDVFEMVGGQVDGDVVGEGGSDTITVGINETGTTLGAGVVSGTIFGDGGEGAEGDDTVIVGGSGRVEGSVLTAGGVDRVTIRDDGFVGLREGEDDSVGLGVGDDFFTMSGGSTLGSVSGGDGVDTFTLSGGNIGTYLAGGLGGDIVNISGTAVIGAHLTTEAGNDVVTMTGGTVTTFVDLGEDDDRFEMSGGTVGSFISAGAGEDTIVIAGGTVNGLIAGGSERDVINLTGGTVNGAVTGDDGNDEITVDGSTVNGSVSGNAGDDVIRLLSGTVDGSVTGAQGADTIFLAGATVTGGIDGGADDDVFNLQSGSVAGPISGSDGNDTFNVSGTVLISSYMVGGNGADTFNISGGTINGYVDMNDGDDVLTMTGGTLNNHIEGNAGNDVITISGGFVRDFVWGNEDDDTITIAGTAQIGGDVDGGSGNDQISVTGGTVNGNVTGGTGIDFVSVSGGTIRGNIVSETVNLSGGTIGGNISGLTGNTLNIEDTTGTLLLADGVVFSGTNAVANITNTNLVAPATPSGFRTQVFQGFQTANVTNSQIGFADSTQGIQDLILNNSALFVRGNVDMGNGTLTLNNSTLDLMNGSTDDVFSFGDMVLNNAVIRIDANHELFVADTITGLEEATASGANQIFVNLLGNPNLSGVTIIPVAPASGTEVVDPNAVASPFFDVQAVSAATGEIFDYDVIFGADGGIYLRSRGLDVGTAMAAKVAIDAQPLETVLASVFDITNDAILNEMGLLVSASRSDAAPSFGIYASGQFAFVKHDGFQISSPTISAMGPAFTAKDFSLAVSAELDAADYFGLGDGKGLDLGVFGGYANTAVKFDPSGLFGSIGDAMNHSAMLGSYGLYRQGTTYGLVSATGFFGNTSINNGVFASQGDYDTMGFVVTATGGHVFAINDVWRFDLRGGVLGATFRGDDFVDDKNNQFGSSTISFGAVKFEPGVFAQYVLEDGKIFSPYFRSEFQQRFAYSNEGSVNGMNFEFDDSDFSVSLSGGANFKVSDMTTISAELRGKVSDDVTTFAGKIGAKFRF